MLWMYGWQSEDSELELRNFKSNDFRQSSSIEEEVAADGTIRFDWAKLRRNIQWSKRIRDDESKGAFIRPVLQKSAVQMDEPLVAFIAHPASAYSAFARKTLASPIVSRQRRFSALRIRKAQLCMLDEQTGIRVTRLAAG